MEQLTTRVTKGKLQAFGAGQDVVLEQLGKRFWGEGEGYSIFLLFR